MAIFKDTWLLTTDEGFKLIRSNIEKIVDELQLDPTVDWLADALGFINTPVTRPDWKITTLKWVLDLEELWELDELPLLGDEEGPEKGYELKRFWGKYAMSRAVVTWLQKAQSDSTIPQEVKDEIQKIATKLARLSARNKKARNFLVTKIFTEGFTKLKAFWPGSSTPYGNPLFFNAHPIGTTWTTQSNIMEGADAILSQVNLLKAIEKARGMKDGNGTTVGFAARSYTLLIGPKQEALARKILNDDGKQAAFVADVAVNNDITISIFQLDGFKINLMVMPTLGQPSINGTIGTGNEWFVLNHELAAELEAFRFIPLYEAIIDSYVDNNNKATYIDIDTSFTADFYNPEVVIGSKWV